MIIPRSLLLSLIRMSKLAAMRATLNREERAVYEKYRCGVQKPAEDDAKSEFSDGVMDLDDAGDEPENGGAEKQGLNRKSRKLARFPPGSVQSSDLDRGRVRPRRSPGRGGDNPVDRRSRSRSRDRDRARRPRSTSRDRGRRPRSSSRERPERRSHRSRSPRAKRTRSRSM